jgi:hypothetical protein
VIEKTNEVRNTWIFLKKHNLIVQIIFNFKTEEYSKDKRLYFVLYKKNGNLPICLGGDPFKFMILF